mmetsp:Transcript_31283/g.50293  ORF Transcript_31283/g.50293 Transcript_31283/m.50293 type:complete len:138 (+) Transcript_31283:45-458(+)|eukprot:CAMPEP_0197072384 /NCGR_PEP_ID=MMETSP1384-20130603/210071_1 /TAXON_ID=29189 /ORGANISM="Ammonia sp." /LENGTH=137 /DNA_ID=CAMNT_0042511201 /DNA_START=44 /DNA_END=457 /DNA_ORIENTATION=+
MAQDNWGQYGHSTHKKQNAGGKKGDVTLKMNWTYELHDGRIGTLKFMGNVEFAKGLWIGLELSDKFKGKHNGTVEGTKYFSVIKKNQGIMVKADKVKRRVASKKGHVGGTGKYKKGAVDTGTAAWKQTGAKKTKSEY